MGNICAAVTVAAALVLGNIGQAAAQYFQVSEYQYAVKFTDKGANDQLLDSPEQLLSQKALDRRAKSNIALDEYDLPVNRAYVDSLNKLGFQVRGVSRWLNCAMIQAKDSDELQKLQNLSFVEQDYQWFSEDTVSRPARKHIRRPLLSREMQVLYGAVYEYGHSLTQVGMHNIVRRHVFCGGQDMTIAIMDDGFYKADQLICFARMQKGNRVLGVHDFVDNDSVVYDCGIHGMQVLSCIVGNYRHEIGGFAGSAPEANVYLFRTHTDTSGNAAEKFLWTFAAETADSLGVDMILGSLGYCSIAATRAASKGIVVIVSSGDDPNPVTINTDNVLVVGAVDENRSLPDSSRQSPGYYRLKRPDVCAMGINTAVQDTTNNFTQVNGTSFAAATLAGCVLCLMMTNRNANVTQLLEAVRASGNRYSNPTDMYGYGIPDIELADRILGKILYKNQKKD